MHKSYHEISHHFFNICPEQDCEAKMQENRKGEREEKKL